MRIRLLILFCAFLPVFLAAANKPFADFREQVKKIKRRSPEDFALGKKLAAEMRKVALARKPFFNRSQLYFEMVLWRGGRLWFSEKHWRDRSLITNRSFFQKRKSWEKNMGITYQLMRDYDADGCNFFVIKAANNINLDGADFSKLSPDEFKLLPTVSPSPNPYWNMPDKTLKKITSHKHVLRIDGKPVYLTYSSDKHEHPSGIVKYFDDVKKRSGKDIVYIADITGNALQMYPDLFHATHRSVAASDLLKYFDHISQYLKYAAGVEYGTYLGSKRDRILPYEYFDEFLLPLFASACAFNGNKILALKVVSNYTNSSGSQTVFCDGTKTLRGYLELCRKYKVDIIQGFEWDEHNENTNLEPTVAKPMAYKRIFRYYMGQLKGKSPAPLPGDDLNRPNLIVSNRRQIGAGEEMEIELLNVPDGSKGKYQVTLELVDQSGKVVYRSEKMDFDTQKYVDRTISIPTDKYPASLFLKPYLTVDYKNKATRFSGLPHTVIRGTVAEDHSSFSTPLRNLLIAKGDVKFTEAFEVRPGIREVTIDADMQFDDKLISAEVVQNSQDVFVYDPQDEFQTASGMNRLFKFYARTPASCQLDITIDLPGAMSFLYEKDLDRKLQLKPFSKKMTTAFGETSRKLDELFIVPGAAIPHSVLKISGKRLNGQEKGKTFSFEFKLADVVKSGITSRVLPDGLHFAVEVDPRPLIMALEIGKNTAKFSAPILVNNPDAVIALRAVSKSGKIYWSNAHAAKVSGKQVPVSVISTQRGVLNFNLPKSRVPHIIYDFNQPLFGAILPTAEGREFYAHIGGFLPVATGFETLYNAFIVPRAYAKASSQPVWKDNGKNGRSLVFDGKTSSGIYFPRTVVPQRHGYTIELDLKPADIKRDQIIFEHRSSHSYSIGFKLQQINGKLCLEYAFREPHKELAPWATTKNFTSDLSLKPGIRQKLVLRYDCNKFTIELNGKKAEFPVSGIGMWLSPTAFGGRGDKRFAGELFGIKIIHSAAYNQN